MAIEDVLRGFGSQLAWVPEIEHEDELVGGLERIVVGGMGGSHLSAGLLKDVLPERDIELYSSYDLPKHLSAKAPSTLFIAYSQSGNTEETISFAQAALRASYPLAIVSSGGALQELARASAVPYVALPKDVPVPRLALGQGMRALARLVGEKDLYEALAHEADSLDPEQAKEKGARIAGDLAERIPVVYASEDYSGVSYIWKVAFNETAKIPSFRYAFPEFNHNEMSGVAESSHKSLCEHLAFLFLTAPDDHPRIAKRLTLSREMLEERGLSTREIPLSGNSRLSRVIQGALLGFWTGASLGEAYGADPLNTPLIEDFKKRLVS